MYAASNILETSTFVFTLPESWERDLHSSPISARGPSGELLQISSARITGPSGKSRELDGIREELEAVGVRTLRLAETESGLAVEKPITRVVLPNGSILNEVTYRARDTGGESVQFSVLGPRTAVLVSLRVSSAQTETVAAVRAAILRIQWIAP
jgi:hypothetical protein